MEEKLGNDRVEYFCSECNAQVKAGDLICPNCGADLKEVTFEKKIFKIFSFKRKKVVYPVIILVAFVLTIFLLPNPGVYIYWHDKMEIEGVTKMFNLPVYLEPRTEFGPNLTKEYGHDNELRWELVMNIPGFADRLYFSPGTDIIWRSQLNFLFADGDRLTVDENHCLIRQSWTRKCWNSIKYFAWEIRSLI